MDPKPAVQLLLTRRPIICRKCMHGNQVEVITDRMNSPVEYHCGCGNYAVVGMPARWPFMEVTKDTRPPKEKKAGETFTAAFCTGSSPLNIPRNIPEPAQQAVITEKKTAKKCKPEKEKKMGKPKCIIEGCEKLLAAVHLCEDHFREQYGITVEEYKANKRHRTETPAMVAARLKGEKSMLKKEKQPAKPPAPPVTGIPATENDGPVPILQIFLYPELLEKLTAAAKKEWRTPEGQAAYLIEKGMRE